MFLMTDFVIMQSGKKVKRMAEYIVKETGYPGTLSQEVVGELIRCKDCRYYIPYDWIFDGWTRSSNINDYSQDEIGCAVNEHNYPPEGFCSFAERKEGEAE